MTPRGWVTYDDSGSGNKDLPSKFKGRCVPYVYDRLFGIIFGRILFYDFPPPCEVDRYSSNELTLVSTVSRSSLSIDIIHSTLENETTQILFLFSKWLENGVSFKSCYEDEP